MSGGSMEYLYSRVADAEFERNTPQRVAFALHLAKVAQALHDIEWVDSSDYGPGDENAAILECLGSETERILLRHVYECARRFLRFNGVDRTRTDAAVDELDAAIETVKQLDGGTLDDDRPIPPIRNPIDKAMLKRLVVQVYGEGYVITKATP